MPNAYVKSIFEIDIEKLADSGVKGIITDLDNTLVGWDVKEPTKGVKSWFAKAKDLGITVTIVSNNNKSRVSSFSSNLGVDYIFKARKPMGKAFKMAIKKMKIQPRETVVVGDQMLTDVFGGNCNGLYTIMVVPVKRTDGLCIGCGAPLQSENKDAPGYVPEHNMFREDVICRRCFRLKNYNEVQDVGMESEDFLNLLTGLSEKKGIIVNVVDVFDFEGSFINAIQRIVGNKKIILVANKIDLLPKQINHRRVKEWLRKSARKYGLEAEDVVLISANKGWGIDELLQSINHVRNKDDVYIVGTTNVGKSTLINKLIEQSVGEKDVVTTSRFPGTTLDMIDIPLDEKSFMFDTPGIIQSHQMTNYVSENELKIIIPKNEIKQRVYQLNEKQTLFFGGLARIDYVSGGKRPLVCFFSNDLNIHRTKTEKANDLWKSQLGALLSPPQDAQQFNLNDVKAVRLETGKTKRDIMISGLGFITIDAGAKVIVRVPKHVDVILRNSIL
ncbi:MAG: ribosome biogenesis GTPase YqeH [Staphylococcus epidermidis]|nr:ribosome biogenesis GTPase YqeH [Staphylococcus epidermidis]